MLRFTPDGFLRLEQSGSFQLHVGGSESNTAVGLSRLGKRVAWISRLTDNPLGRRISGAIAAHGVDTSHVVWTDRDRVGLYFFEVGSPPRNSQVLYDRSLSAFSQFSPDELPIEIFASGLSRWLHITGISLWLGETTRELVRESVRLARAAGWKISFDVNHRTTLCSVVEAKMHCQSLFESADVVFLPSRDAIRLWQMDERKDDNRIMKTLLEMRQGKTTVMTLGGRGAMVSEGAQSIIQLIEPVEPIGRLGGGDAFSAGFLSALLDGFDLEHSLRWAVATARLKYSIPGDLPLIDRKEVENLVCGQAKESTIR